MAPNRAFRDILATFDVLETFELLPKADQERFSLWIENSSNDEARLGRLEAFVLALRLGPLQADASKGPSESLG
jgi:hypothetical protein